MTCRTIPHHGVTMVWEDPPHGAHLAVVAVNGDRALAERIYALLNADNAYWARVEQAQPGLAPGGTLG